MSIRWNRTCIAGLNPITNDREAGVNTDIIKGKWLQLMGDIRQLWGKSEVGDMTKTLGDAERFIWKLQERYGYARDPGPDLDELVTTVNTTSKAKH